MTGARWWAAALALLALVNACDPAPPAPPHAPTARHALQAQDRAQALRLVGSLHRQVAAHPTIRLVLDASCADFSSFLLSRSLDVSCAVSGYPGQTFHGKVSAVHRTHAVEGPVPPDSVYGRITVDVDNAGAKILPGHLVAASFAAPHGSPLIVFGLARPPGDASPSASPLALRHERHDP